MIHHSDRGVQVLSLKYTERLTGADVNPSVGSVGDSTDGALAETVNGLYKAEAINPRGPWPGVKAVEFATLQWVDRFNHRRLLDLIEYSPSAEAEARYHETLRETTMAA